MSNFQNGFKLYTVTGLAADALDTGRIVVLAKGAVLDITPHCVVIFDSEDGDRSYTGDRALAVYKHWARAVKKHWPDLAAKVDAVWEYWEQPGDSP